MESRGGDAGAPEARADGDEVAPARDERWVAIDPLSTDALRWADDDPAPTAGASTWAPPAGPPFPAASAGAAVPAPSDAPPRPRHAARHSRHGPDLVRRDRRTWLVVLAAAGVVVVGVAAVVLGGDDGGAGDDARASTPMTVPTASGDGTDPTGPIVGPSGIVGAWSGSGWVSRGDGQPPGGDVELTLVGLSGDLQTAPGVTVDEECAAPGASAGPDLAVELPDDGPPPIAVAGVAEPRPRPVELLDTSSATYQQAAAEVGAGLGVQSPPTLTQVVRSDLDGSGTDEVVVAAEHAADPATPQPGDWSVVFLRRVVGNGVATDVVASSIVGADGGDGGFDRIRVSSLADLNADGKMEIVLDGRSIDGRWIDGQWTAIHELGDDGVPAEVLRDGCAG